MSADQNTPGSWIGCANPDLDGHLTPAIESVLQQVAAESKDGHARIYTQAEVIRAIELAINKDFLANARALELTEAEGREQCRRAGIAPFWPVPFEGWERQA